MHRVLTKFKPGDKVFFIKEGKITSGTISDVLIKYGVENYCLYLKESEIFDSKEELLKSLDPEPEETES